jgi:hypothetical protein
MPDPTITISSPTAGGTVTRTFTVSGTYSSDLPNPTIGVVLKDASGNVVAMAANLVVANGQWSGTITAPQAYSGAKVQATMVGGASASAGNITVQ